MIGLYAACVDFILNLAALLSISYRDANALLLLVAFPLTTLVLALVCLAQRLAIRRARAHQKPQTAAPRK